MSNCKNCIHYDLCSYLNPNLINSLNSCKQFFVDKSKFIELPCRVGDVFYGINETSYDAYCVYGFKYGKSRGEECNEIILITTYDMEFVFGKEAFLTKEEADEKLKELSKNYDISYYAEWRDLK